MRSLGGEKGEKGPKINGSERNQCLGNKNVFDLESLLWARVRPLRSSRSVRNCAHSHAMPTTSAKSDSEEQFLMLPLHLQPFFQLPQAAISLSSSPVIAFTQKKRWVRSNWLRKVKRTIWETQKRDPLMGLNYRSSAHSLRTVFVPSLPSVLNYTRQRSVRTIFSASTVKQETGNHSSATLSRSLNSNSSPPDREWHTGECKFLTFRNLGA